MLVAGNGPGVDVADGADARRVVAAREARIREERQREGNRGKETDVRGREGRRGAPS